ncbi:D-alanyl-D-alanine carboxypeptidase [hydrothermal vent metagenome]|uniref:D-alanyl-D-alanine carboxypeptidase n=1 Tax=hydrothermal vent metagenome TaxID=652676 RepID=A0A3B1CCD2_9ZZZZ
MFRKKYIIPAIILLSLIVFVASSHVGNRMHSFNPYDSLETFTAYLNESIPEIISEYDVPGICIGLINNGKPVWSGAYGFANLEHGERMNVNAVFRVESISKSVTAWGVMKLVEKGLIDLDAPLETYLGEWQFPESEYSGNRITLRQLLSHTAGMPLGTIGMEYPPDGKVPSLRETLSREAIINSEPDKKFSYSNTGFNLLELIIEEVTGRSFAEYMKEEILLPLGMSESSFEWNESYRSLLPKGYDLNEKEVAAYVYPSKASGGLFSTVEDIARFVSAGTFGTLYDSTIVKRKNVLKMYSPHVKIPGIFSVVADAYGFGHFIEELSNGRAVWHGGQGHGWMSHFHLLPESGEGIVILTNSQRSWPVIAEILNNWARWKGLGSLKMGRIKYGITAIRIFIYTILIFSILYLSIIIYGLLNGRCKFSLKKDSISATGIVKCTLSLIILGALAWSSAQPYLIVSSIFPGLAGYAGYSLLFFAAVMFVSSFFPKINRSLSA